MKTLRAATFGLVACAALAQAAAAADLGGAPRRGMKDRPYDAPPAYSVPFTWSGLYVGAHVGYSWTDTDWQSAIGDATGNGAVFGGQVGYNWQSGALVYGIEGDISSTNISGDNSCGAGFICSHSVNWMASVRGRLGTAFNSNRTLLYGTAGVAWADIDYATTAPASSFSQTHVGWVVGGGLEHALTPNLTARVEYLYYSFDEINSPVAASSIDPSAQTVRFGLNFKF